MLGNSRGLRVQAATGTCLAAFPSWGWAVPFMGLAWACWLVQVVVGLGGLQVRRSAGWKGCTLHAPSSAPFP